MGKKGSWISAIKKVFTHSSKDKVANGTEKKTTKEKKKKGFRTLFREPSSIEKILGEAERERQIRNPRPPAPPEQSKVPPHVTPLVRNATLLWDDGSSRGDSPPMAASPPRVASPPRNVVRPTTSPLDVTLPTPPVVATPPSRKGASLPQAETSVIEAIPSRVSSWRRTSVPQAETSVKEAIPSRMPSWRRASVQAETSVNEATPSRAPSRPVQQWRPEPTLKNQHICAAKIQTAYRGYMARRSYRALRGMVRLQGVVKGQSVKRQTANALKCMQMLVRVQTQIQARRIQMLENQAAPRQAFSKNEKDLESAFDKWLSENQEDWDDSTLTKEDKEARMQRKFDAIVKRERAMAYAYSHQSWKSTPRIGHGAFADFRTGGYPYWWKWMENRQPPQPTITSSVSKSASMKSFQLTPTRPTRDFKASPYPQSSNTGRLGLGFESPKSTRSSMPAISRQSRTPPGRLPPRFSRGSAATSPFNGASFRDDDSLTSCPPFSFPRYMSPTASAQAKLKTCKERAPDSPGSVTSNVSKRRVSYPLSQGAGSLKGSSFNRDTSPQRSIASTTSMPVSVGRRAFNRFV